MIRSIENMDLKNKKVLIRVDFNVPLKDGKVADDTRIRRAVKTVEYALNAGAKVCLLSHLGRPKGEKNLQFSMEPVADYINERGIFPVKFVRDCVGDEVAAELSSLPAGRALLLENVRFYKEEEKNDPEFAKKLAEPFDAYINDAFGTCHRKHASVYGVADLIPEKAAGFLVEKEAGYFDSMVKNPSKPFAAILGGAKVSDKTGVIKSLLNVADVVMIGGAMSYTFLKYRGAEIGSSIFEEELMPVVADIFKTAETKGVKILLPEDHVVSDEFCGKPIECPSVDIPAGFMGLDIGPKTAQSYETAMKGCKTILWNGPMGVFENPDYAGGTFAVARALANSEATSIVGGGDSASAVKKAGVADKIDHISTGGGASLEYLEFGTLPGIDVLRR